MEVINSHTANLCLAIWEGTLNGLFLPMAGTTNTEGLTSKPLTEECEHMVALLSGQKKMLFCIQIDRQKKESYCKYMGNTSTVGSEVKVHKQSCRNGSVCKSQHGHFCQGSERQLLWMQGHMILDSWAVLQVWRQASKTPPTLWSAVSCFPKKKMQKAKPSILQDARVVSHSRQANAVVHA